MTTITPRTRLGLDIFAAALLIGAAGDGLLRAMPWGLNVPLAVTALVAAAAVIARRARLPISPDAAGLGLSAVLLGMAFVRRDAEMLQFLDVVGLLGVLAIATLGLQGVAVRVQGLTEYLRAALVTFGGTCIGILPLALRDIQWSEVPVGGRLRHAPAVALGLVIAFPLLLVFGSLFASADATFASVVTELIDIDFARLASHTVLFGVFATLAGGYLWTALMPGATAAAQALRLPERGTLGIIPVGTALGLLNLLFLVFIVTQAPYLFGGAGVVASTTGLTLAEFARRGFFQLVFASALVLPVLLAAQWGMRNSPPDHLRSFRALAALLLLQLGGVMGSALWRMQLYVAQFGLSQDRVYATVFMGYLAIASAWFAWTVLRGRHRLFAFGVGVQGYAVLAALHLINVDGLIARTNLARATAFDVAYHTRVLSGDAVPALIDGLPRLGPTDRADAARVLLKRWRTRDTNDWRSWNWAAAHARGLVARHAAELEALAKLSQPKGDSR